MNEIRRIRTQIRLVPGILHTIIMEAKAADRVLGKFFLNHNKLGKRDRAFVTELVYGVLRSYRTLHTCYNRLGTPGPEGNSRFRFLVACYLLLHDKYDDCFFSQDELIIDRDPLLKACASQARNSDLASTTELPDWILDNLPGELSGNELSALSTALDSEAPLDIRVNKYKTTREMIQTNLSSHGHKFSPTPYSPIGLRSEKKIKITTLEEFSKGDFEIQDEGSQLSCLLAEPRKNEVVVDLCAGAGGKSLLLAAAQQNTGVIYAFDNSKDRIERLVPRLKRSGLQNVKYAFIDNFGDARIKRLRGKADKVVIDAPCSGSGTLRRHPEIKWRSPDLANLAKEQIKLLQAAAELVKPGGKLLYITCSLLLCENENVVSEFLKLNKDFCRIQVSQVLNRLSIRLPHAVTDSGDLRLYPHRHGTDGFYACVLLKK